jgi:hypothetical protein
MKKRILMLLSVVALMVVMLAMSVAPAFAAKDEFNCRLSDKFTTTPEFVLRPGEFPDRNADGIFCVYQDNDTGLIIKVADNHPALPQPV